MIVVIGAVLVKRYVRKAFENLMQRDMDTYLASWADDAVFIYPGTMSVSGETRGKKAIVEFWQKFLDQFPSFKFTIKHVCVERIGAFGGTNVVTAEWDIAGTNKDSYEFQNSGITLIEGKKGKAVLVKDYYFDTETLHKAWGEEVKTGTGSREPGTD